MMITLPNETDVQTFVRQVLQSLDAVADRNQKTAFSNRDWFPEIASEIAKSIKYPGLKCYARGKRRGIAAPFCEGTEWNNLDFLALLYDEDAAFPAQAVLVGEVEWSDNDDKIDEDFEKVLIVDAFVFFMVFLQFSREDAMESLNRLEAAYKRRQAYGRQHG